MNFGVWIPNCRHLATPDIIRSTAVRAEQLGYDSVWVSDHVVVPHANVKNFGETVFDPLITLGVAAGATRRVQLGTTVLIVPYRNAVVTAKMIASLDALSGGRVVLGIGAGWVAAESAMLGVPFAERGAMTDEYLTAMRELWTKREPSFSGKYTQFSGLTFEPKPLQKPHPPIWVGGHSRAALRRTARHGDGWHPVGAVAPSPLPPHQMRAHLDTLKQLTEAEGRDFAALTISYKAPLYDTGIPSPDGSRRPFSGEPEQIAGDIRAFAAIGVHELIFDCRGRSIAESIERLQRFATEVIPLVD